MTAVECHHQDNILDWEIWIHYFHLSKIEYADEIVFQVVIAKRQGKFYL